MSHPTRVHARQVDPALLTALSTSTITTFYYKGCNNYIHSISPLTTTFTAPASCQSHLTPYLGSTGYYSELFVQNIDEGDCVYTSCPILLRACRLTSPRLSTSPNPASMHVRPRAPLQPRLLPLRLHHHGNGSSRQRCDHSNLLSNVRANLPPPPPPSLTTQRTNPPSPPVATPSSREAPPTPSTTTKPCGSNSATPCSTSTPPRAPRPPP